jgi:hypothetical protein
MAKAAYHKSSELRDDRNISQVSGVFKNFGCKVAIQLFDLLLIFGCFDVRDCHGSIYLAQVLVQFFWSRMVGFLGNVLLDTTQKFRGVHLFEWGEASLLFSVLMFGGLRDLKLIFKIRIRFRRGSTGGKQSSRGLNCKGLGGLGEAEEHHLSVGGGGEGLK